jgi:hypothetical protein
VQNGYGKWLEVKKWPCHWIGISIRVIIFAGEFQWAQYNNIAL